VGDSQHHAIFAVCSTTLPPLLMTSIGRKMNVLFLCTGNSCRSQIAEGWARTLLSDSCVAYSAGLEAHGLNTTAIRVMAESGVDVTTQLSQTVAELPNIAWDLVVTVCDAARESCPYLPGVAITIHHSFIDPPAASSGLSEIDTLNVYRNVRDEIKEFVVALPKYFSPITETA